MSYKKSTVFITGTAKISKSDPVAALYDVFFVGLIIDRDSHKVVNFTCNMVREVTNEFIQSIVVDYDIVHEVDEMIDEIKDRFHGLAQKSVCASIKDARNKYLNLVNN